MILPILEGAEPSRHAAQRRSDRGVLVDPRRQRLAGMHRDAADRQLGPPRIGNHYISSRGDSGTAVGSTARDDREASTCTKGLDGDWLRDFAAQPRWLPCLPGLQLPARVAVAEPRLAGN